MAITITNDSSNVKIAFDRQTIWVPKPFRVTCKPQRGSVWILQGDSGVVQGRGDIKIPYAEVTSPVTADIDEFAELMATYAAASRGADGIFTNADLTAGVLTIVHGLGTTSVMVVIRDPAGLETLVPNTIISNNSLSVDFGGAIGAGNYTWFVLTK